MNDPELGIQRRLLRNEALHALKNEIARGTWKDKLPSERYLTESFQLSRGTLRNALKILADEGVIASIPKQGHFIRKRPNVATSRKRASKSIGLLSGDTEQSAKPSRLLNWLPDLQSRLARDGWTIHVHEAIPELNRSPKAALLKLLEVTEHRCWLLARCSKSVQSFFQKKGLPALICGSPHPDIELPFVDVDHKATGRHAVGILAARGHRHIGFVASRAALPGDLALLEGFQQGVSESSQSLTPHVIRYPRTNYDFETLLSGIASGKSPITGLLIDRALQTLKIATRAAHRGIKIPEQLYLISREDADFFDYVHPTPGRYRYNERNVAQKFENRLRARLQGDPLKNQGLLIIPDFME